MTRATRGAGTDTPSKREKGDRSPAMQQFFRAKEQYPDALLFFRMGDFYELFHDDAIVAAKALELALTSRQKSADGEEIAWDAVRLKLQEIIDAEDKQNPHSDDELVLELAKHGLTVARRTVTKYRKAMSIPSSRQRRDWSLGEGGPHDAADEGDAKE